MSNETIYHVFQPLAPSDKPHEFIISGDGKRAGIGISQDGARTAWVVSRDDVEEVCAALRRAAGVDAPNAGDDDA